MAYVKAEKSKNGNTIFRFRSHDREYEKSIKEFSYKNIIKKILSEIVDPVHGCLTSPTEIDIVGHRLIHGPFGRGSCCEITEELLSYMRSNISLAPLHYPANLEGIMAVSQLIPIVKQAGVFDTSFHETLPLKSVLYGIPFEWYREYGIRRYGFHGISHHYASVRLCEITGLDYYRSRIISCHLGNGSSVAAVSNGRSVDTSMGMTPVEGLLMGTRSGDIDAGVIVYLQENYNLSVNDIQQLINEKGGLFGLSGVSPDYRDVEKESEDGNDRAKIALDVYHYRIKKYIGAYAAAMGGIDALAFTGGIGENRIRAREEICSGLEFLGVSLSKRINTGQNGREGVISRKGSKIPVVVIPAREELIIAREVAALSKKLN